MCFLVRFARYFTSGFRSRLAVVLIVVWTLSGCGIRIDVAQPTEIPPTQSRVPQYNYSGYGVWRQQATPRLVFTDARTADAQLFMQQYQPDVYLLQGREFWLNVAYDAVWFESPSSTARVRLNVYYRHSSDEPWLPYENVERDLLVETSPTNINDSFGIGVWLEEPGVYQVRAEVGLVAYPAEGEIINQVSTNEVSVLVMPEPGEISGNTGGTEPGIGSMDAEPFLLLDWRLWQGGPCFYLSWVGDDPARESIESACVALSRGDLSAAGEAMVSAIEQTDDDELRATLYSALAYMLNYVDEFDRARDALLEAIQIWEGTGQAYELAISLHNLIVVEAQREDREAAENALLHVQELRGQFYDEVGDKLLQANVGRFTETLWQIEDSHYFFLDRGMQQSEITGLWIDELNED
jgi:tetratricopeptide (TPR) repeat protein